MTIAARYSFNGGAQYIQAHAAPLLDEVYNTIKHVNATQCFTKTSQEKTKHGVQLYSPINLNKLFKQKFSTLGWKNHKQACQYSDQYYTDAYKAQAMTAGAFRDMDFVKNRIGVEVQFGKYSFMVYNVCAKMTIFRNLNIIDAGIEIVPVKELAQKMSSGVSYFEQFVWDLEQRGVADIDVPVLILGVFI